MDQVKRCKDCGLSFVYSESEQRFFRERGLSDPARCPSCRALRSGIADRTFTCNRCRKPFVIPRELQLYARSYGWDLPTRCLGGCGIEKFGKDYKQSDFETKATSVLGSLARFIFGRTPEGARSAAQPLTRPQASSRVNGFASSGVLTDNDVTSFIETTFPKRHQDNVRRVLFTGKLMPLKVENRYSRGFYNKAAKVVAINRNPLGSEHADEIKHTITHEFGHAAYAVLRREFKVDEWIALSSVVGPITPRVKPAWSNSALGHEENFAEAYRLYVRAPQVLRRKLGDKAYFDVYYFLLDHVFKGREYS